MMFLKYASGLTSTPKAELFCSCKRRKFIGQNKVKICKLQSQNFKFLGKKIGCPIHNTQLFCTTSIAMKIYTDVLFTPAGPENFRQIKSYLIFY